MKPDTDQPVAESCLDSLLQPQTRIFPEGEEPRLVKCEVFDCNEPQTCFHYCQEHHKSICMQGLLTKEESDLVIGAIPLRSLPAPEGSSDRHDLLTLRQLVEDTIAVAQTEEDTDGFITAYHFQTGAIHRLLAEARKGTSPAALSSTPSECPQCGYDESKWVTIGTIKVDIENETETFERAALSSTPSEERARIRRFVRYKNYIGESNE